MVLLMLATLGATWWMAREQDATARAAARQMVAGGLEAFVEQTRATLLDYAAWTAAYDGIVANDTGWVAENIGDSARSGTFDLAIVEPVGGAAYGWDAAGGPQTDLLSAEALGAANRLIDALPVDSGSVESLYAFSGGTLWFLAIGRVVPQDGVPQEATDASLPRLVVGFEMTSAFLGRIGERFMIENLAVGRSQPTKGDFLPLAGPDGTPLAWVSWTPPTPGAAVLRATLWPLLGLMLAVAVVLVLVSRELVGSARRLEAALQRAQAADRTKTEFLSNVSHELRTPLNGVIGLAQLLQLRAQDAEAQHMLDLLLASARSQLELVNGLLDITQIESGTMALRHEPFDPGAILDDTVRLAAPEIDKRGLVLRVAIAAEARRTKVGDPLAYRQIATNLIGNALKFTDRGGITVALDTNAAGALVLNVSDTGVGIPASEHGRIFERFVQVDGASTRRVGGVGLGLAITRALVELMNGTIKVNSAPGKGSTFTVELPLPREDGLATAA